MDALERTQKISDIRPHAFRGVAMHFANSIAIIVTRIFMNPMFNGGMRTNDVIVTVGFIGVDNGFGVSELMDMIFQGFARRVWHNAQTHLSTFAPNGSNNRGTIIRIRAAPALVVSATARRI
jgi:hypothetical protein